MNSSHLQIVVPTLTASLTPYLGLLLVISLRMHGSAAEAAVPSPWILSGLFVLGVVVPCAGVIWTLRWILSGRLRFQLSALLEAYGALIVLFASSYAIAQASSTEASFVGLPLLWSADPVTLGVHIERLHDLFFESLYLSVMTITTVGYGDLAPISRLGKVVAAAEGLAGIGFIGIALGHYFSVCLHGRPSRG